MILDDPNELQRILQTCIEFWLHSDDSFPFDLIHNLMPCIANVPLATQQLNGRLCLELLVSPWPVLALFFLRQQVELHTARQVDDYFWLIEE